MPLFNIHAGSWTIPGTNIRLPDIGLTERIAQSFGQSMNTQGGSQLRQGTIFNVGNVPYTVNTPINTPNMSYTPDAGGGFYTYKTPRSSSQPQPQPTNTGGGGGGGGGRKMYTPSQALAEGKDINELRRLGLLIEESGGGGGGDDYANRIRSNIESAFNQYMSQLDRMAGLIPQMQQEQAGFVSQQFGSMLSQLGTEKQAVEQRLETYRQDVEARKKAGLSEIEQNLRNLLKATGMQLGAMGAGSSSASQVIAPYAIAKQGARAQAQVIKGANEQFAELDRKMIDVQTTYDTQKSQIDQWKNDKLMELSNTYNQLKLQIEQAKAQAPLQKAEALNRLDQALLQNAIQMANYYEQSANQYKMALDAWVRDRIAQLQNFKIQLSQSANFNPVELTYDALRGISGAPQASSYEFYNPVLAQQIRKRLGLE